MSNHSEIEKKSIGGDVNSWEKLPIKATKNESPRKSNS